MIEISQDPRNSNINGPIHLDGYEISQDCILEPSQKFQKLFAKSKEWHYLHSIIWKYLIESNVLSTIVFRD